MKAAALKYGTHLRTPSGSDTAVVTGGWIPRQRDGWMWDLTIPGNNDHDFYIDTTTASVLVHNCSNFGPGQAKVHYDKHVLGVMRDGSPKPGGADMPEFLDQNDYVQGAQDLLDGPVSDGVDEGVRGNGVARFDNNSGAYGVKTAAARIKTFFRPDTGRQYFTNEFPNGGE